MSRGHGRIQRDIVAEIENCTDLVDTFELAANIYRVEPNGDGLRILNDAQLVSVRRALVKLAAAGKVFKIMRGHNKRAYWGNEAAWCRFLDMTQPATTRH
jgi:hypothetical protein